MVELKIDRCWKCKSKELFNDNNDFIVCMNCREVYELVSNEASTIDWFLWKRQYNKYKKKLHDGRNI